MAASLRAATPADAKRLAEAVAEGAEVYRGFAPTGWEAPSADAEEEHLRELLDDPAVWCVVAEADGELVGQVTLLPAASAARPVDDPALGHLRNLFVREDHWGTGLAGALHAAAVEAARDRGYAELRLFTPADQARARRFYEREGWVVAGEEFHDPGPGMPIVEYRHALVRD